MIFAQEKYLDENGFSINADQITHITTYLRMQDGFFRWTCGCCLEEHISRSFELPQGFVHKCIKCGSMNLLLSSATNYIREAIVFWEANKPQVISGRFEELGNHISGPEVIARVGDITIVKVQDEKRR